LLEHKASGGDNYDSQANQNFAKNLKGKLLLAHGTMDTNVPPYNTLLVVNELIKANKDLIISSATCCTASLRKATNFMLRGSNTCDY
jgi:dipeptidyl-peptidase 4